MQNQSTVAERLKETLHNDARTHIGWIAKPVSFVPPIPTLTTKENLNETKIAQCA